MIKEIDRNMKWIGRLFLLALSVWLGGCQSEDNSRFSGKTGLLITLTDEADQAYSRMAPSELEDPLSTMFKLRVVDAATNKVAYSGKCEEFILLKEGTYNLTATYGENPVIALDAPYYVGTLEGQRVVTGQETAATVSCAVANALLSVNYNEESLKKAYEDYSVTVSVDDQSVEIDSTGEKSAYFQAGSSVKLVFHGHLAGTGKEVSYDIVDPEGGEFSNIPAKTHVKVTLGIAGEVASGVGISIEKLEVSTVSVTETLPMEFMPKPKVESTDFVNNELSFAETETKSAVINLNLSSPLQDLKLKFNSADAKFAGLEGGKEYQLSNADDKAAVETALGITLPEIGATEGSLDFSSLTPRLMTDAGNTVSSTIEVDVKANNRWASEDEAANRVYTLKCNKPEFSISVDERNCWSREFTIDEVNVTTGNPETIKANLVYQYYDGSNWIDCTTREAVKGRIQQFTQRAEEISNKVYKVRALYRGEIASAEAEATLETPVQLPNSGMEEWHYSDIYHSLIEYNPWNVEGNSFWNTNNAYTTRYKSNAWGDMGSQPYNCFPAVSYVPGRNGRAAELRNTAAGRGNTRFWGHTELDLNKVAGELFIGDIEVVQGGTSASPEGDHYVITKGKNFSARPTGLRFWYKYLPCNQDTWKATLEILDENKEVIAFKTIQASEIKNEFEGANISLDYKSSEAYAKCKYIYVVFSSTINIGSALQYNTVDYKLWKNDVQETFEKTYVGSVLTIDDISLVYDK